MNDAEFEETLRRDTLAFCEKYSSLCRVKVHKLNEPWEIGSGNNITAYEVTFYASVDDPESMIKFSRLLRSPPFHVADNDGYIDSFTFVWTVVQRDEVPEDLRY